MASPNSPVGEVITRASGDPTLKLPGVELRKLAVGRGGREGFSTGTAIFDAGALLPCHTHTFSEIITVLDGECRFIVEGRTYRLRRYDTMHVPRDVPHHGCNALTDKPLLAHWTYTTTTPALQKCETPFQHRDLETPPPGVPEQLVRFDKTEKYELAEGTKFCDLFGAKTGCPDICGGYGEFAPGTGLPCHTHEFDESINIVRGHAVCMVAGRRHELANCDTAMVPQPLPHRFLNESKETMAMIWVYASGEASRTIVDAAYCTGERC